MAKRYYWLKLSKDYFRQKEIKKLRQIAGGDTYTVIYLKLLLLSLDTDGKLFYDGLESDFASEMALEIDESPENVSVAVNYLVARGILQQNTENEYELVTAHEMTGSESDSAHRVREHRLRKELQCNATALHCNTDVTIGNTEKEKEKETEKRKSKAATPPRVPRFSPPSVEKAQLSILDNSAYAVLGGIPDGIPSGTPLVSPDKNSLDKTSIETSSSEASDDVSPKNGKGKTFPQDSNAYKAAALLARLILERNPELKPRTERDLQRWANDIDKINRLDGYEWEMISDVLTFSQRDPFWQTHTLSGAKLRKQFETLYAQMKRGGSNYA